MKFREWFSIQLAKNPGRVVLSAILLFNVLFLMLAAVVISSFSIEATKDFGFWESVFYTITMILDAGCIQFIVADVGTAGLAIIIICLLVVVVGMVTFTGALIGYLTNYISGFIANANAGSHKLELSDHIVVLNWNTRASEIINDMLYCEESQKIVVLVSANKEDVERELHECISDTLARENRALHEACEKMPYFARRAYLKKHERKNHLTVIVREGDTFSTKQLRDISIERARAVVILGNDINNTMCKFDYQERMSRQEKGNAQTVKTLIQVADMTGAETSFDDQKIIVEIDDAWTMDLVEKIILTKQVDGKCNIVPLKVNQILGQILSQFSLMPELNRVYRELFSNKGMEFFSKRLEAEDTAYNRDYLARHSHAIPLTCMHSGGVAHYYYAARSEHDIERTDAVKASDYTVKLTKNFRMEQKKVLILGHNSKCKDIMAGFDSFLHEWQDPKNPILEITVIDDKKSLEKLDYYRAYPYVSKCVEADIYDKDIILSAISEFMDCAGGAASILILSDDTVLNEEIDAAALANLIYVQDMVRERKKAVPSFDADAIDIIVEILDPKNHDIVTSYSINNVVISNRYISKMITQLCEKESMFDFYNDILTYDSEGATYNDSKEIYIKKVARFFEELPGPCSAEELIRAVYDASVAENTEDTKHMSVVFGYVKYTGEMILFEGNQKKIRIDPDPRDKLILFSDH